VQRSRDVRVDIVVADVGSKKSAMRLTSNATTIASATWTRRSTVVHGANDIGVTAV
jgi:hypothetical protein